MYPLSNSSNNIHLPSTVRSYTKYFAVINTEVDAILILPMGKMWFGENKELGPAAELRCKPEASVPALPTVPDKVYS